MKRCLLYWTGKFPSSNSIENSFSLSNCVSSNIYNSPHCLLLSTITDYNFEITTDYNFTRNLNLDYLWKQNLLHKIWQTSKEKSVKVYFYVPTLLIKRSAYSQKVCRGPFSYFKNSYLQYLPTTYSVTVEVLYNLLSVKFHIRSETMSSGESFSNIVVGCKPATFLG